MHEMAITQSILDIALSEAKKHHATKVKEIRICVGDYSGVVPAIVQDYYNLISAGTIAEQAKLIMKKIPVTIQCLDCQTKSAIDKRKVACPICNSVNIKLLTGREFYVESLEVDEEEDSGGN